MTTETKSGNDMGLNERYQQVKDRIEQAAQRSGRRGSDVLLGVVTKNADFEAIQEMIDFGHVDFGESKVQNLVARAAQATEYIDRINALPEVAGRPAPAMPNWHMVGRLQRNKVRKALEVSRLVHSVDSLRLVEEIQAQASKRGAVSEVLVEVNVSGEAQKIGIAAAAVRHVIDQIDTMLHVKARGLMCMAPNTDDEDVIRNTFTRCAELFEDIQRTRPAGSGFNILSMGMSNDYEIAIECGANLVRVGSAIVGDGQSDTEIDEG